MFYGALRLYGTSRIYLFEVSATVIRVRVGHTTRTVSRTDVGGVECSSAQHLVEPSTEVWEAPSALMRVSVSN